MQPTIFTVFYVTGIIGGGTIGAQFGFELFGWLGGTIGTLVGGVLATVIGNTLNTFIDRLMVRSKRRKTTSALRAELNDDGHAGTYVSSVVISILLERGEPVGSFREYIFRQLNSDYVTERRAGDSGQLRAALDAANAGRR